MSRPLLAFCVLALAVSACTSRGREDLALLRKDDPEFENLLALKAAAEREIAELEATRAERKAALAAHVRDLETAYREDAERLEGRVRALRAKIARNREVWRREITELRGEIERNEGQIRELEAGLEDIGKVLERTGTINLSTGAAQNLDERRQAVESRVAALTREIEDLRGRAALKSRKLQYL
jgi:chromosome segregation ATPase